MVERITGQDVKIQIIRDGEVSSVLPPLTNCTIDVRVGEYFGASVEPLPWADIGELEFTFKVNPESAPAFVRRIGEKT